MLADELADAVDRLLTFGQHPGEDGPVVNHLVPDFERDVDAVAFRLGGDAFGALPLR